MKGFYTKQSEPTSEFCMKIQRSAGVNGRMRESSICCNNQGGTAGYPVPFRDGAGGFFCTKWYEPFSGLLI